MARLQENRQGHRQEVQPLSTSGRGSDEAATGEVAAVAARPETDAAVRLPTRSTWILFCYLAIWGYVLYGLGNAVPYLRADLRLTDFEAGLHSSAVAIGVLAAALSASRLNRWIGSRWLPDLAAADLIFAIGLVILAPSLPVSLAGALLIGFGGGTLGIDVNYRLGRAGGPETRKLLAQGNAVAMIAAASAPVAIGLATSGLHAWRVALLVPIAGYLALTAVRTREPAAQTSVRSPTTPLPGAYRFAWLLLLLGVSIEFSFVYWSSTIIASRTGVSSAESTLLASLFVAGMFVGRAAIGRGLGANRAPRRLLAVGLCGAIAGASLMWVSTMPALSAIGLFVGGLGTAGLWPVGLSVALQTSPNARLKAAAWATVASGFATLLAPSALGLAADIVGVAGAWPIVMCLAAAALLVLAVTPRAR